MRLRVARHTNRLDEVVRFYRDDLGLPEIGRFDDHQGYEGVFLPWRERTLTSNSQAGVNTLRPHRTQKHFSPST
jgi:YycE-like protein